MAQLCPFGDELIRLRTRVLIVSFAAEAWARAWLQETGSPFPLLLDPDRGVYRAYGLQRSILLTWSPQTIWYYARQIARGRRLHPVLGDPYQLGGDFIVDAAGIIRFAHRGRNPADRPAVGQLISVLRGLQGGAGE